MKVIIASDPYGFNLKRIVSEHLKSQGVDLIDMNLSCREGLVDYVDCAQFVGRAVSTGLYDRGILICGTGTGMSIAANKVPGIRATLCHTVYSAHMSRAHNNANILCMGEHETPEETAFCIVDEWFKTDFEGGSHVPSLAKLDQYFSPSYVMLERRTQTNGAYPFKYGVALSPRTATFAPLLYSGRLPEGIQAAAESGFDGIELSLRKVSDISVDSLAAMLQKYNLSLIAIATGQSWTEDSLCLCDRNQQVRAEIADRLKSIIDMAAGFNAMVILGGIRGRLTGTKDEQIQHRPIVIDLMREIIQYAESKSITVVIEPINRFETNFINNAAEGLTLLDEIGLKTPKLLLDTFHMNIEEVDPCAAFRAAGNRLGYVHFSDSNRRAPEQGHTDFLPLLQTLLDIGYQGCITDEILPFPDDATAMQQAGNFMRSLKGSSRSGKKYIISSSGEH
jgi:5-keto-L-gluconate epimerase